MEIFVDAPLLPIKTILYATDFSSGSEHAGHFASLLARRFDAELLVAHAFVLTNPAMEAEAEAGPGVKSEQRKKLESALVTAAGRFGEGLKKTATVLVEGDAREQIPRLAQESSPSLIVLGTEGRGRVARGIVGSVAERILRATGGPSLTVGPAVPPYASGGTQFRRVVYATGLSRAAARGAAYAAAMAEAFDASLEVLHVVHPEDVSHPGGLSEIQKQFEAALRELVPQHVETFRNPHGVVEVGSAHERIAKHLRESQADLLVLSIRKSSHLWLESRLSGAFQIIASAPCPVLTITG